MIHYIIYCSFNIFGITQEKKIKNKYYYDHLSIF